MATRKRKRSAPAGDGSTVPMVAAPGCGNIGLAVDDQVVQLQPDDDGVYQVPAHLAKRATEHGLSEQKE